MIFYLLNPRRGTLQISKKSIKQSEESYSTLISNPEILIMLKNIRAYIQKTNQTFEMYNESKCEILHTYISPVSEMHSSVEYTHILMENPIYLIAHVM